MIEADLQQTFSIILASKSPRRSMLLKEYGYAFSICSSDTDEIQPCSRTVTDIVVHNAQVKGEAVLEHPEVKEADSMAVLLAADTLVVCQDRVYGKPADLAEARSMLQSLAMKPHKVLTGLYMNWIKKGWQYAGVTETIVTLKRLSNDQMDALFQKSTPLDKAAAYGFQDAPEIVHSLQGSKTNVIGLPMETLQNVLGGWRSRFKR